MASMTKFLTVAFSLPEVGSFIRNLLANLNKCPKCVKIDEHAEEPTRGCIEASARETNDD